MIPKVLVTKIGFEAIRHPMQLSPDRPRR